MSVDEAGPAGKEYLAGAVGSQVLQDLAAAGVQNVRQNLAGLYHIPWHPAAEQQASERGENVVQAGFLKNFRRYSSR